MTVLNGYAHKLGDRINTDRHVSMKGHPAAMTGEGLIARIFRDLDPQLAGRVKKGDFIVAGECFGTLSTADDAIEILKKAGISAVIAKSFGHLFFRSAINGGLWVLEAGSDDIQTGDYLIVDIDSHQIRDETRGIMIPFRKIHPSLMNFIMEGGAIEHVKKHGDYRIEKENRNR